MSEFILAPNHSDTSPQLPTADQRPGPEGAAATSPPSRRRAYRWLVALHVASAAAVIGADLAVVTLAASGLGDTAPQTIYPAMSVIANLALGPAAAVTLASGLLLAWLSRYGLFRFWWVTLKLAITLVLAALVQILVVPGFTRAADAATGGDPSGFLTDDRQLVFAVVPALGLVLLLVSVLLAVHKPRWRVRRRTR